MNEFILEKSHLPVDMWMEKDPNARRSSPIHQIELNTKEVIQETDTVAQAVNLYVLHRKRYQDIIRRFTEQK